MSGIEVMLSSDAQAPMFLSKRLSHQLKIEFLATKQKLKNKPQFKQIYVRDAKSQECLLLEQNM